MIIPLSSPSRFLRSRAVQGLLAAIICAGSTAVSAEPATVARTPEKLFAQWTRLDAVVIASSAAAVTQAVRPDVRRFARLLLASHGGGGLGAPIAVTVGPVRGLPGPGAPNFDAGFVELQLNAHVGLINLCSTYATEGLIPPLRHRCKRRLRVEHAHYREAIRLRELMRGPIVISGR